MVVWGRLVNTVHPGLEDDSISVDTVGALCPSFGHLDMPPPPGPAPVQGATSEFIYRGGSWLGTSEVLKHGLGTWKVGLKKVGARKGWNQKRMQAWAVSNCGSIGCRLDFSPEVATCTSRSECRLSSMLLILFCYWGSQGLSQPAQSELGLALA